MEAGVAVGAGVAVLVACTTGAVLAGFTVSVAESLQAAKDRDAAKITNSFFIMIFFSSVDSQPSDRLISHPIALHGSSPSFKTRFKFTGEWE